MMGLHPCYVKEDFAAELRLIEEWLAKRPYAAIGEIGLDFYWDKTFAAQQDEAFRRQIDLAAAYDLPIIIHSREATAECLQIVAEMKTTYPALRGIFHCYAGTAEQAERITALNFLIGIGGVVTYKNAASLHDVIRAIPLEFIVLETDAPYLPPVPYRGKRNESSYIPLIAQKIADLKEVPLSVVEEATTRAAQNIFRL
jgi:TatD DNase family protein